MLLGCFAVPILVEPDYGTTLLISAVGICLMLIAGAPIGPLTAVAGTGLFGVVGLIFQNPERMRIMAFLDPQTHEQGKAWQLANSLPCLCECEKMFGVGFGNSFSKISLSS